MNAFLSAEAANGHITVVTEGTFGLLPYAIEMYLVNNPNITIVGIWPLPDEPPVLVQTAVEREPTYLVTSQKEAPVSWKAQIIAQYQKGLRRDRFLRLYKL